MARKTPRRSVLAAALLITVSGVAPAALGGSAAPTGGPLEPGPWSAVASASGVATASEGGITMVWTGTIPAQFEFAVVDGGSVTGTWAHQGDVTQEFDGVIEGMTLSAIADFTAEGSGPVSGTSSLLQLDGNARTVGSIIGEVDGISTTIPIDNPHPLPTMFVRVSATACHEAYGEWAYTIQDIFEEEGFSASFEGHWIAFRDEAWVHEHLDDLLDRAVMGGDDVPDFSDASSPLFASASELLWRYNDFVDDFPNWRVSDVIAATEWAELLINGMRNLSDCDLRLFGEDLVEVFFDGLTFVIQNLITSVVSLPDGVPADAWQQLVHIASRSGAIGPGSPNPELAVEAEEALIAEGARILEANRDDDGYILVNDDTVRVMATGAAMGWEFDVAGEIYDARQTFDSYLEAGGSTP